MISSELSGLGDLCKPFGNRGDHGLNLLFVVFECVLLYLLVRPTDQPQLILQPFPSCCSCLLSADSVCIDFWVFQNMLRTADIIAQCHWQCQSHFSTVSVKICLNTRKVDFLKAAKLHKLLVMDQLRAYAGHIPHFYTVFTEHLSCFIPLLLFWLIPGRRCSLNSHPVTLGKDFHFSLHLSSPFFRLNFDSPEANLFLVLFVFLAIILFLWVSGDVTHGWIKTFS